MLFRAHADERRGLFFTYAAANFFNFLAIGLGDLLYVLTIFVGFPVCILKIDKAHTTGARARALSGPPPPSREGREKSARLLTSRARAYFAPPPLLARAQRNAVEATRGPRRL